MALQEETPKFKNKSSDKNAVDILGVQDFDAVEFYVGNAYQSAYYYQRALGFKPVAWSSLKTGNRKYASYVMQQGNAKIVLTSSYEPSSEISSHQLVHGDGAKSIGLRVRMLKLLMIKQLKEVLNLYLSP